MTILLSGEKEPGMYLLHTLLFGLTPKASWHQYSQGKQRSRKSKAYDKQVCQEERCFSGILRCEEDLLCKSIEVLGETAHAVSLRTSLHTMRCANFTASAASFE